MGFRWALQDAAAQSVSGHGGVSRHSCFCVCAFSDPLQRACVRGNRHGVVYLQGGPFSALCAGECLGASLGVGVRVRPTAAVLCLGTWIFLVYLQGTLVFRRACERAFCVYLQGKLVSTHCMASLSRGGSAWSIPGCRRSCTAHRSRAFSRRSGFSSSCRASRCFVVRASERSPSSATGVTVLPHAAAVAFRVRRYPCTTSPPST